VKRIERLLRAIDRFQQRHSVLGLPFGVLKKYGDDQGGKKPPCWPTTASCRCSRWRWSS
jgi:hypothetical protein